jgi:hypothetical protein
MPFFPKIPNQVAINRKPFVPVINKIAFWFNRIFN